MERGLKLTFSSIGLTGLVLLAASFCSSNICPANITSAANAVAEETKAEPREAADVPVPRTDDGWSANHERLAKLVATSNAEIAFFGDSITEGMNVELLHKIIGPQASNFGIGGDRTQHLLWRLQNGEMNFPAPGPKAFVVLIGTNNISSWAKHPSSTNEEIVEGVKANIEELKKHFPKAKILLLAMLPRDENPDSETRKRVDATNKLFEKLADNKKVVYADISKKLLEPNGKLSPKVMADFLHPTPVEGYQLMFSAIKPHLDKLMK